MRQEAQETDSHLIRSQPSTISDCNSRPLEIMENAGEAEALHRRSAGFGSILLRPDLDGSRLSRKIDRCELIQWNPTVDEQHNNESHMMRQNRSQTAAAMWLSAGLSASSFMPAHVPRLPSLPCRKRQARAGVCRVRETCRMLYKAYLYPVSFPLSLPHLMHLDALLGRSIPQSC